MEEAVGDVSRCVEEAVTDVWMRLWKLCGLWEMCGRGCGRCVEMCGGGCGRCVKEAVRDVWSKLWEMCGGGCGKSGRYVDELGKLMCVNTFFCRLSSVCVPGT